VSPQIITRDIYERIKADAGACPNCHGIKFIKTDKPGCVMDCSCSYVRSMESLRQQLRARVRDLWLSDFSAEFIETNLKRDELLFKSHGFYGPPATYCARLRHLAAFFIASAHVELLRRPGIMPAIFWIDLPDWMANQGSSVPVPKIITPERIAAAAQRSRIPRVFINMFQINTHGKGGEIINFRRESIGRLVRAIADSKGQLCYSSDLAPGAFSDMYGQEIMQGLKDCQVRVCNLYGSKN
jgi:hypothetical protein